MGKRIWQYPEATGITNDDVILLDSPTGGSRSIKANEIGSVLINKTFTERGTFDAAEDNADGYKKVTVDVPYTDILVASGPIASWDDGEDLPLKSLTANIEPQQDLHGYDAPWVGGAGKNKIKTTWVASGTKRGLTYVNMGDFFTLDGLSTNTSNSAIDVSIESTELSPGDYIMNGDAGNNDVYMRLQDSDNNIIATKNTSFTLTESKTVTITIFVRALSNISNLVFKPMIRLATEQDATFAPYSNICPISGWDECNVTITDDISTPTESHVYTAEFVDSGNPMTVYGGYVDIVSGLLTVDRASVDLGTLSWTYESTQKVFYDNLPTNALNVTNKNGICEVYKPTIQQTMDMGSWSRLLNGEFVFAQSLKSSYRCAVAIKDLNYTDTATFKSSVNGMKIVYPLATPITYQLTAQQINSLIGDNNIYSDTGDVDVEYQKIWVRPSA